MGCGEKVLILKKSETLITWYTKAMLKSSFVREFPLIPKGPDKLLLYNCGLFLTHSASLNILCITLFWLIKYCDIIFMFL